MKTSESIKEIAIAICKMQKEIQASLNLQQNIMFQQLQSEG